MWCCGLKKGFCNQSALKRSVCLNGGSAFVCGEGQTNPPHQSFTGTVVSLDKVASIHCLTDDIYPPVSVGFASRTVRIMTVLLKNLFTVHFQFDLLKLETNNTRDDKMNHAWIIARWTDERFFCVEEILFSTTVAKSGVESFIRRPGILSSVRDFVPISREIKREVFPSVVPAFW